MLSNGIWSDLIVDFLSLTESTVSPDLFRKWAAISLVAGALERRVWARVDKFWTYPNLYILLVAPPGVGKQIVEDVQDLWRETTEPGTSTTLAFHVGQNSLTKASLVDVLAEAKRSFLPPAGRIVTYHSLLIAAEEFGVLLPSYDQEFIAKINYIFNNPQHYSERRRTGTVRKLDIELPQLNLLAGASPSYFVGTFPEVAWSTGLARRIIMIYSSEAPFKELWQSTPDTDELRESILQKLSLLAGLYGQVSWTTEAADEIGLWHRSGGGKGGQPVPTHSKLEHYARSRTMHAIKLAIISAVARTCHLVVEAIDVRRAIAWLLEAEALMPDIFRAMVGKSDVQIIEELYYFVQAQFARSRSQPVSGETVRRFLTSRIPHDKIESLLAAADRANIVAKIVGTDTWLPRPKHEHGVE